MKFDGLDVSFFYYYFNFCQYSQNWKINSYSLISGKQVKLNVFELGTHSSDSIACFKRVLYSELAACLLHFRSKANDQN
ncbi:unnamed protein product [Rhizophagus irregularis]|nr:unnamed protein product [Rhizophagus irregularis]CAB5374346.1 unnamed protein product [Rhizophagus irregularis]